MTNISSDADIERIGLAVLTRTLPKPEWTHAAHFAAAFWLLTRPDRDAMREMPGLIRVYNEATGVANTDSTGYHETITLASLRAARAWLHARPHRALHVSLVELLASDYGRSDWLLVYWSRPCCSPWRRDAAGWSRTWQRCPSKGRRSYAIGTVQPQQS